MWWMLGFLLPYHVLTLRLPIGDVDTIVFINIQESLDDIKFYRVWFRWSYLLHLRGEKTLGIDGFQTQPADLES